MKRILPYFLGLVSLILIATSIFFLWRFYKQKGIPQPPQNPLTQGEDKAQREDKQNTLIENVKEIFRQKSPGTSFSIAVYDLKNDEYFAYNDTKAQHAASVSKVLTATYVFDQVEKGKASLSDPMGAYNLEFQLEKMINISNSESWDYIDQRFKPAAQNKYAASIGLKATNLTLGKNLMSTKDVATLFKKLAKGELLSEESRQKLFTYMQKTESEDFFSPVLKQAEITFYHKTGKYEGEGHDAAIVEHGENPFVLVVFSNNNTSPNLTGRGAVMSVVASEVLEYFNDL